MPDTVYNFQFIVDAFTSESTKSPDTASSAPMKLDVNDVSLKNVNLTYTDAIAGSDMFAHIGEFAAHIDTIDPYTQHFVVPQIILRNSMARMKQIKPLVEPKPLSEHISKATAPSSMNLQFGTITLEKIDLDYGNDVSAFYTIANIGELKTKERTLDLTNNKIDLDNISLNGSKIAVRLGKTKQAQIIKQEVKKEAEVQKQAGWNVMVNRLNLDDNSIQFDDDNKPAQSQGIDYSHISATNLSLEAENFIMNPDSIAVNVRKGTVNEKSGLVIEQLKGDILYAKQSIFPSKFIHKNSRHRDKKNSGVNYPSLEALTKILIK